MPRVALEPGQNSIERAAIVTTDDGGYRMQWSVRLMNGRILNRTTKGKCSKGELRRRARQGSRAHRHVWRERLRLEGLLFHE